MFKWLIHPKMKDYFINYSNSCRFKRPPFIFETQIKIFLMEFESSLTIHRQKGSLHDQGPET